MTPVDPTSFNPAGATGLLLTGGGARAAYQVGVLEAIADLRLAAGAAGNPFPVITGTSAGAINAAALACGADDFDAAVRRIADVWQNFHIEQVYRADSLSRLDAPGWHMLLGLAQLFSQWRHKQPRSLLDNSPLIELLRRMVPLERLPQLMAAGHVRALAVTASSYSSGEHFTFYESAAPMEPWVRSQRRAVPGRITHAHLMASSAIPFVFPATGIAMNSHKEYFGDGSMRQSAPIASAIHLGAQRVLVVGAGRLSEPLEKGPNTLTGYPTLAQIAGHALSSIFLDALAVDIERLHRINQTLALIPPEARQNTNLRPIELLVISPSERIDVIAARHTAALPGAVRRMFGGSHDASNGGGATQASALASYLLFDAGFTRELMALGRADTLSQREEVRRFFGWSAAQYAPGAASS
jgi:NTE family protein